MEESQTELLKNVLIQCPECQTQKFLKVPSKILEQSENVVTISIPTGMVCEHHFQAFVDHYSSVRGYQVVDFEFPKVEFIESRKVGNDEDDLNNLTSLPLFQEIINLLRSVVDNKDILGSAIFTVEGTVLYSSISQDTLLNTIREFEVRDEKKMHSILRMLLELRNHQKVCAEYIEINKREFILVLVFSRTVKFGIGNLKLKNITQDIIEFT
ncbi:MAG: hypothetical protein ACXAEX_08310 [Promethearchaeota archaeon]|jgi:hypothetical protein